MACIAVVITLIIMIIDFTDNPVAPTFKVDQKLTQEFGGHKISCILVGKEVAMIKFDNKTAVFVTNNDTIPDMFDYTDCNDKCVHYISTLENKEIEIMMTDGSGVLFKGKSFLTIK